MDAYPGEPTAAFSAFSTVESGGIAMSHVTLFSQLGTHVDAPSHFIQGGASVDQLSLEAGIGPAVVVDVAVSAGASITVEDLKASEEAIREHRRVILRTGWSGTYGEASYWTDMPALLPASAQVLVDWGVTFLGLDTPTPSIKHLHDVHQILLGNQVVLAESLVGVEQLTQSTVFLICLPLPLVGLDGAPSRIVALE